MTRRSDDITMLDEVQLRRAVAEGNVPTLVMVLFQLTGDRRWLQEPYRPTRGKGLSNHDSGGLPPAVRAEIQVAAVEAIGAWWRGRPPAIPSPSPKLLTEMLTVCMGEPVPEEYEPMMAELLGCARPDQSPRASTPANHRANFSVIVIGAGISGLTAALKLREAGVSCLVLEKNDGVGGTWRENRYPGCGVDTPSYLYSFSFFSRDWSTHFAKRDEVMAYLEDMAETFDLLGFIRFGTEVLSGAYDQQRQRWTLSVVGPDGQYQELTANAIITAVGQLNRPKVPSLFGMDAFTGHLFHSARWPSDLDIRGKRVAVIGTGASAMQIVPAIVKEVAHLTVFQRSPQWIAPNENYFQPISDPVHWLMEALPFYRRWYRARLAWTFNDKVHASLQIDPSWEDQERSINAINDGHRKYFTAYLYSELDGRKDLQEKALPTYPPFGKRMLLDNGWYAALRRPNVDLVTAPISEITDTGVRTSSGEECLADIIVMATGFEAQRLLFPIELHGRSGTTLLEAWGEDDATAYLGVTVPDFPNLFLMYGPNTNPGHGGSYITIAECQITYIIDLLCQMVDGGYGAIECRADVHAEYNQRVDAAHEHMIWTHPGMNTWYRNGRGRVVANLPWRIVDYWKMTRSADLRDFHVESGVGAKKSFES